MQNLSGLEMNHECSVIQNAQDVLSHGNRASRVHRRFSPHIEGVHTLTGWCSDNIKCSTALIDQPNVQYYRTPLFDRLIGRTWPPHAFNRYSEAVWPT